MENKLPKASEIKLITTDIDGTLLDPNGKISKRTETVIKKVLQKYPDLHFILASGRARPATTEIREALGIVDRPKTESLLCNGCIVYDSVGNIIWESTLPIDFLIKFYNILKTHPNNGFLFSCGDDAIMVDEKWEKIARDDYQEQTVLVDKEEYIKKVESGESKVNKVCYLVNDENEAHKIMESIKDLKEEYDLECVYSTGIFLEYMPKGTNKGTGLAQLLKKLNISKNEVIAFGDGNNDIELFQNAEWTVAMENARENLKSHAKYIAKSNAEDGVADILEKIFLKDELKN